MALSGEVHELAAELGWKPWKPSAEIDRAKVLDEFADVIAFFGSLAALVADATDASPEEMWEAYRKKTLVSHERFTGKVLGYARSAQNIEEAEEFLRKWKVQYPSVVAWLEKTSEPPSAVRTMVVAPVLEQEYDTDSLGRVQFMGWEGSNNQNWVLHAPDSKSRGGNPWKSVPKGSVILYNIPD